MRYVIKVQSRMRGVTVSEVKDSALGCAGVTSLIIPIAVTLLTFDARRGRARARSPEDRTGVPSR